jgi:hypothetical protein
MRAVVAGSLIIGFVVTGFNFSAPVCAGQNQGTEVKIGSRKAIAPADWKKVKPANLLRSYQFQLPGVQEGQEAELAVFPESHPDPEKNFPKWKGQFVPPVDKTIDDLTQTTKWDLNGATAHVLIVTGGTWKYKSAPQDPRAKEILLDNYRVIWVIVVDKDEATHIRLSGPIATVEKHQAAFEKFIKSLK